MDTMWKQLLVETLLKNSVRSVGRTQLSMSILRTLAENASRLFPQHQSNLQHDDMTLAELSSEKISPENPSSKTILYFHGGGFCLGSLKTHRAFIQEIVQRTQITTIHVEYPLAPEHTFPSADEAVYNGYQALLQTGLKAEDIILAGDDSGANLALTLMLRLIRQDAERPCGLILLSPFLDLTLTSDSVRYNKKLDSLISPEFLQKAVNRYAPQPAQDVADPRISPLYADLDGLPPTLIQVGSKSLLLDDATRFKTKAKEADVEVSYKLYTGMWHNFMLFNHWFDEPKQALQDMAIFTAQFKSVK